MISDALPAIQAGLAFDTLAAEYDTHFTHSHIGRAQRNVVWTKATEVFQGNLAILELNCGTGEDAMFLASLGHRVTALDASHAMIGRASRRKNVVAPDAEINFQPLPSEYLSALPMTRFDAVFSNFSGLNCVRDLRQVAEQLAYRTRPGAQVLLCISTRFCLWEAVWFLLQGKPGKASRRWSGESTAVLNGVSVTVHYPTIGAFAESFAPQFTLCSSTGVGIFVPPSYLERWMRGHLGLLKLLCRFDSIVCRLPALRALGDHVLLHFERTPEQSH
jgi:SAM-dependent methyltransferase